jgi:hypothetical protein
MGIGREIRVSRRPPGDDGSLTIDVLGRGGMADSPVRPSLSCGPIPGEAVPAYTARHRIHPSLPAARAPRGLRPDPLLRAAGQPQPATHPGAVPRAARRRNAGRVLRSVLSGGLASPMGSPDGHRSHLVPTVRARSPAPDRGTGSRGLRLTLKVAAMRRLPWRLLSPRLSGRVWEECAPSRTCGIMVQTKSLAEDLDAGRKLSGEAICRQHHRRPRCLWPDRWWWHPHPLRIESP